MLCSSQCNLAVSSFSSLVTDADACPLSLATDTQRAHRTNVIGTFSTYCNNFEGALGSNGGHCSTGAPSDSSQCGFRDKGIQSSRCPSLVSSVGDRCCSDALESQQSTSAPSSAAPAAASSNTSGSVLSSQITSAPRAILSVKGRPPEQ
ncbi:hypothetical protein BC829DRAFT_106074 [Chytridium lagenaria]|nr:hypothetical protein BC829DRAFT_106074 [Chytridium lagenaria]